jgi:hypothetical protein
MTDLPWWFWAYAALVTLWGVATIGVLIASFIAGRGLFK